MPYERSEKERLLLHPVFLCAVGLLLLNDHALKPAFPAAWWTGKLSDVAGLTFFPVLLWVVLLAVIRPLDRSGRRGIALDVVAGLTAVAFTAVQLSSEAAEVWRWGLGVLQLPFRWALAAATSGDWPRLRPVRHTLDDTDLVAVPAVLWGPLTWRWGRAFRRGGRTAGARRPRGR